MRSQIYSRSLLAVLFLISVSACKGAGGNTVVPNSAVQPALPQVEPAVEEPMKRLAAVNLAPGAVIGADNLFTPKDGDAPGGGHGAKSDGVPCKPTEYVDAYHIHFYVGIIADRRQVALPDAIGLVKPGRPDNGFISTAKCFYYIHTHDGSGTVHIEVPRNLPYSDVEYRFGQMLSIWGVSHGKHNFGPFKGNVQIFVGNVPLKQTEVSSYKPYTKSIEKLRLRSHEAIWIVIGKRPMLATSLPPVNFYTEY